MISVSSYNELLIDGDITKLILAMRARVTGGYSQCITTSMSIVSPNVMAAGIYDMQPIIIQINFN